MSKGRQTHEADTLLVQAALDGDRDAFGQLIDTYKRVVFSIGLSHLRNEDDAMDLVQDTFLKAWTRLDSFQVGSNFKAWVCRIATNASIDKIRRNKIRRADELDDRVGSADLAEGKLPAVGTFGRLSPLEQSERNELGQALYEALNTLPETHRQCVLLCDVQGYSYQEISDKLGIPRGTVMSRLFYARRKLQAELGKFRDEAFNA
ncbi:MAG TPA: RNA polymerase subunit sigma-24 [Myxococcales bacterium]|nr:RNA polymerase subunit sigma-24 [Myxococcales bacterium]HAN32870.1 RNA polymerase subunit sigma-24 [Myxococcales bacterium]